MVTLIVCDDEEIERIGLTKILQDNLANMEIIGHAENGKQAIQIAIKKKPDIILMDIKMPVVDGLQASEHILKHYQPKIVIVSSYDTFSYAQRAVSLGVRDYILKPSKEQDIVSAIEKVIVEVEKDREEKRRIEQAHNHVHAILPIVEADIVLQLLFDYLHEVHIQESMRLFEIETTIPCFAVSVHFVEEEWDREKREHIYSQLKHAFHKVAKGWFGAFSGKQIPLIIFLDNQEAHLKKTAMKVIRQLLVVAKSEDARVFFGIGQLSSNIFYIKESYYQSLRATINVNKQTNYCFFEDTTEVNLTGAYEIEQEILEHLQDNNWRAVKSMFVHLIRLYQQTNRDMEETKLHIGEILTLIYRYFVELGIHLPKLRLSRTISSYDQLFVEAEGLLTSIQSHYAQMSEEMDFSIAKKVKQLIDHHYMEDITLDWLADKVEVTSHYVSKLYKDHFDISYIDYLTKCRIRKAKEYIQQNQMSLKEISLTVGYKDPNYFSRVFKKNCGISPSQYKEQLFSTFEGNKA
ncbi:response regulator [Gracilibacillus massiliensis]|uniref:response regulator n=1 Tax=Gracilibacillus massiliensis TaxID=1564956 RepID=UPI00071D1BC2|nr:response regulator [Gracilibacillus massiliensis]